MNQFRVDRVIDPANVPCGMNSIVYIGDNYHDALRIFRETDVHLDTYNQPNPLYGVIYSVWHDEKRRYITKCRRGF